MITQIPFPGFYESWYSHEIDREQEQWVEYATQTDGDYEDLTAEQLNDLFWYHTDYSAAYLAVAKDYADAFNDMMYDRFNVELGLTFESMSSPREYNFSTDRIFCHISEDAVTALRALVTDEALATTLKRHLTGYDGFIPFYSNRLEEWSDKPLSEWDHNELLMLFYALLDDDQDWEYDLFNSMSCDRFYSAFEGAVDWPKFEQAVNEIRLVAAGEAEDDGRQFPLGITDTAEYVAAYEKLNGIKPCSSTT